jgi:FSR family fosmidomycin resistance protein-like MFS transporter
VDFTCFFILFHGFGTAMDSVETVATGFLLYNVIAFGLQPAVGFLCDGHPEIPIGIIGCALVATGLLAMPIPWVALALCATGNACFHIGGGIDSLIFAKGRMTRSGIFVSTGAIGVTLGTLAGRNGRSLEYLPYIFIGLSILLLLLFAQKIEKGASCRFDTASGLPFAAILIFALASVVIRALAGGMIPMSWKTGVFFLMLPGFAACAGKALGGILGDRFGAKNTAVTALLLSVPFLLLGKNIAVLSVIGIILFNITMPITLCAVASKFPYNPGLTFGLTTLALLCGTVPAYFFLVPQSMVFPLLIALTLLSATFTFLCTKNKTLARNTEGD